MNIVVCVKQIPDPAAPQSFDASNNLNRSGKLILDEADTYGVEMALQLVDKAGGGEVTVVSMGSASDVAGLRNALAMGATKAVIVSDDSLRGSDALSHREGARQGHHSRELRSCARRHRVVRRLHRHDAGAARRTPRTPVHHLRQGRRRSTARP